MNKVRSSDVVIWEDNQGGECALRAGAARSEDHNLLVHAVWLLAARLRAALWVERVASDDNIADDPSREEYSLLEAVQGTFVAPIVPEQVWDPASWMDVRVVV